MRSPVKTYFPDRRRPIERPSILIPCLVWIIAVVAAVAMAWLGH